MMRASNESRENDLAVCKALECWPKPVVANSVYTPPQIETRGADGQVLHQLGNRSVI